MPVAAVTVKPARPEWKARALIGNNRSAFNGGYGIPAFRTMHETSLTIPLFTMAPLLAMPNFFPTMANTSLC